MSAFSRFVITGDSPDAAGRAVVGKAIGGLGKFDHIPIPAELEGATGGTLDVYLQANVGANKWVDVAHFPQLADGAAAIKYSATMEHGVTAAPVVVGISADDPDTGAAPVLAANTVVPGHPGELLRCVAVAGGGTSAGVTLTINLRCIPGGHA